VSVIYIESTKGQRGKGDIEPSDDCACFCVTDNVTHRLLGGGGGRLSKCAPTHTVKLHLDCIDVFPTWAPIYGHERSLKAFSLMICSVTNVSYWPNAHFMIIDAITPVSISLLGSDFWLTYVRCFYSPHDLYIVYIFLMGTVTLCTYGHRCVCVFPSIWSVAFVFAYRCSG
jgi:hypothetical protein